jgi:DNA-binding transcriptional LysR family regulator
VELRHLRTFVAVAELRHFARAADRCNLSQPAVSQQIRQLEAGLAARLLNRAGRRITLTVAGELLLAAADRARERVHGATTGLRGRVRIGATQTPGLYFLPDRLRRYRQAHPQFELHFEIDALETILARVAANELDMAVVAGVHALGELRGRPIAEDPMIVVAAPHTGFAKKPAVLPSRLAGECWIVREEGSDTRRQFDLWSKTHGCVASRTLTFTGCDGVKAAVIAGLGIALVSRASVHGDLGAGRLAHVRLRGGSASRSLLLVDHPHKHHGPACGAMIQLLAAGVRSEP